MKIPIYTAEEKERLRQLATDEYLAYEEEAYQKIQESVRTRTMTKQVYENLTHCMRELFWRIKNKKLFQGLD